MEVMAVLRRRCPWDAQQTHRSLVPYLVEEACETVEAIESGDVAHLREELGDLLLQVVFHAEIAGEAADGFTLEEVAAGIADKLVARHPHVFAADELPADLHGVWEQRKAAEKGRRSALEGIPEQLSALSRAAKILNRARSRQVPLEVDTTPIAAEDLGAALLTLVTRATASGLDAEQAARDVVRGLERRVRDAEVPAEAGQQGSKDQPRNASCGQAEVVPGV